MDTITKLMQLQIPAIPTLVSFIWLCCMLAVAYKVKYGNRRDLVNVSFILLMVFYWYLTFRYNFNGNQLDFELLRIILTIYVFFKMEPSKEN